MNGDDGDCIEHHPRDRPAGMWLRRKQRPPMATAPPIVLTGAWRAILALSTP